MPSKREASARVDYVPALCTHRPSLLPIEWFSEISGAWDWSWQQHHFCGNLLKLDHLEEVKVVTRFPLVNQRKDHYHNPSLEYINQLCEPIKLSFGISYHPKCMCSSVRR